MTSEPSIPEWFRDRGVLVTGGTGFMGKVLVSKLLMSCPNVGNIFLLVREKRGVAPKSRLHSLLQLEPFRTLREDHPERLKKLVIISADTTAEGLGLSLTDKARLIKEVSVIFHMAANVKFNTPLKTALAMNTKGTANLLELAKQMPSLSSLVHVSTAFCQCGEEVLEEKFYESPIGPEKILSVLDWMKDDMMEAIEPKLLGVQPNTYAFSKSLSETLVAKCGLPSGVARPSMVGASWKEPAAGWVDNMNGPTGLLVGAGKGVIRSMLFNSDYPADIIPCDLAVNATIALAWKVGLRKSKETIFLNVTNSEENPISWRDLLETGKKHVLANPFSGPLWYPGGRITTSRILHWFSVIFFHLIPAYIIDGFFTLAGQKTCMVRIQAKVSYGLELLQYYTNRQWIFKNEGLKDLQKQMSSSDNEIFFMDLKAFTWDGYMLSYNLGTRKYVLKDESSTLPHARRVFMALYILDRTIKIAFLILAAWSLFSWIMSKRVIVSTFIEASVIN